MTDFDAGTSIVMVIGYDNLIWKWAAETTDKEGYVSYRARDGEDALQNPPSHCEVAVINTDTLGYLKVEELARLLHERFPNVRIIATSNNNQPEPHLPHGDFFIRDHLRGDKLISLIKKFSQGNEH